MPFTLAHPAAVIPLPRLMGRFAVPSALVVGSVTPDLAYILPFNVSRASSHSLEGLLWFCLPVGCAVYLLFHLVLQRPLLSLLPVQIADRLAAPLGAPGRLPAAPWYAVLVSLLVGAVTHLVWDALTHNNAAGVRAIEALSVPLFVVEGYRVFGYKILQHGSSLLGGVVLLGWTRQWLRSTTAQPLGCARAPSAWRRVFAVAVVLGVPICVGLATGLLTLSRPVTLTALQSSLSHAAISSLAALAVALLTFSLLWHLRARGAVAMQQAGHARDDRGR